jgi:hypothetical protein
MCWRLWSVEVSHQPVTFATNSFKIPGEIMIYRRTALLAATSLLVLSTGAAAQTVVYAQAPAAHAGHSMPATTIDYPETRRGDVVDTSFGEKVADPYRWLENDVRTDKEVAGRARHGSRTASAS